MIAAQPARRFVSSFCEMRDEREVRLERARQQLSRVVDHVVDADDMIVDVAEVGPRVLGNQVHVETRQAIADLDERGAARLTASSSRFS